MKIKKTYIIIAIIVILVLTGFFYFKNSNKDPYKFKGDTLYYSENRGSNDYNMTFKELNDSVEIYETNFKSKNFEKSSTKIYGLLFLPQNQTNIPGIVFLPGGGGTKESRTKIGLAIAKMGYGVLIIDQRGIGQTGGVYLDFQKDYEIFKNKTEPIQHLCVYDALKSFDVLSQINQIDKNNIIVSGESMGARYAIIAAAIDKRLKGVLAISTSGYNVEPNPLIPYNSYFMSIDPDHYIKSISPNYVVMIHSSNDSLVKLKNAQRTFDFAKEPKKFYLISSCDHGYCDEMKTQIQEALKLIFGR